MRIDATIWAWKHNTEPEQSSDYERQWFWRDYYLWPYVLKSLVHFNGRGFSTKEECIAGLQRALDILSESLNGSLAKANQLEQIR